MSKHTPGPWLQSHRKVARGYSTQVYTGDGQEICTLAWYPMPKANGWIGTYREANARLIAAAPELLEAVRTLADDLEDGHWSNTKQYLRELVAKATGECA